MKRLSAAEAAELLDAIDADDPERAHSEADTVLLLVAPDAVVAAYGRLGGRCRWWACA